MPEHRSQLDLFAAVPRVVPTVSELTYKLKSLLEERFARVAVQGEISNLSRPSSGHVYFTLRDPGATLDAVLFRTQARALKFQLQDGQKVIARGNLSVFEARGKYQILCDTLEPTGLGALAMAFEQLKSRLAAEGLFDKARKRAIPRLPRRIGVVTSLSGAAIRDFLRVLHNRFPSMPVLIASTRVQGEGAGAEIARAVRMLGRWSERGEERPSLDVIVLTRGGGSLEDLWAFNDEAVARAIAASPVPVISAVGHEVDFTISDFVADARAATPTAAAELVVPSAEQELDGLRITRTRLTKAVERHLRDGTDVLTALTRGLGDPRRRLETESLRLDELRGRLEGSARQRLQAGLRALSEARETLWHAHPREQLARAERDLGTRREALHARIRKLAARELRGLQVLKERLLAADPQRRILEARAALVSREHEISRRYESALAIHRRHLLTQRSRLDALSPLRVMERGYAIAFAHGHVVSRHGAVGVDEAITVRLGDQSELDAQVTAARPVAAKVIE